MTLHHRLAAGFAVALFCLPAQAAAPAPKEILKTYADVAEAMYADALTAANTLDAAVTALLETPTDETLKVAREAWVAARVPYQQTEGFRFGNPVVDEWEGKVNAWPLDEGLIDYVDKAAYGETSDENPLFTANIIASKTIRIGKDEVDAAKITKELLSDTLQEAQGVEANVATGYHAIEFLLWGQDLNGTDAGAGRRPATDFSLDKCTGGNCDRRREYLQVAAELLTDDLQEMVDAWGKDGAARKEIEAKSDDEGLAVILTGLGSLSYGELAGERMKLGLILHDPEEEHDCFSDNTHNSHYYDQIGMASIYNGTYKKLDGSVMRGPSLADYVREKAPEEAKKLEAALTSTTKALGVIKKRADDGIEAYDQMLAEGNTEGNVAVQAGVDALVAQARAVEGLVDKLGLKISVEGSDSLDNPSSVQ
jgi:putative iron-regulated protein